MPAYINFKLRSKKLYEPKLTNTKVIISKRIIFIENIKQKIKI